MDYKEIIPEAPEGMAEWLHGLHRRGREVLIYKKAKLRSPLTGIVEPMAECKCSYCGAKWYAEVINNGGSYPYVETQDGFKKNGDKTDCPECGVRVEIAHARRLHRYPIKSMIYPWTITQSQGCVVFTCWRVMHEVDETGSSMEAAKRNAYIVTPEGKWVRYTATERAGWSRLSPMAYTEEWNAVDKFQFADSNTRLVFPHPANVYEGTALENAKLEIVERDEISTELTAYAKLYLKRPKIENLVMTCPKIAAWILREYQLAGTNPGGKISATDWINWDAAKPHEMLRMEKAEMSRIENENSEWRRSEEMRLQQSVAICKKLGISPQLAEAVEKIGSEWIIATLAKSWPARAFGAAEPVRYIAKQMRGGKFVTWESARRDCMDYWKDLKTLEGADLESLAAVFPSNLAQSHARIVAAKKYKQNAELVNKFKKTSKRMESLAWEQGDLLIRVAESESELIAEGKILGHCVGGYGEMHCSGKCIFFIRRMDSPEMPYFTLQLDTKTGRVIQNRGRHNCGKTKEVEEFEAAWLREIVKPWVGKNSRKRPADNKAGRVAAMPAA